MPRFQILPVEQRFFDLFEQHARTLRQAADRLRALVESYTDVEGKVAQLTETEHEADFITHEIIDLARRSFTTRRPPTSSCSGRSSSRRRRR